MRRTIEHDGARQLTYEIREIVQFAHQVQALGVPITWENIGDPVRKGEQLAPWMKKIISELVLEDASYAYSDTQGEPATREFLADMVNRRGGCQVTPDDIVFFNGLGDAVAKIFGFLKREARVIGPSPAYSTHSSAEAAHSGYEHLTYTLDPNRGWQPDLEDLENKVTYNPSIAGILLINPDNPTGVVYSPEVLLEFVRIAKEHNLFLVCDETYANIVFDGARTHYLSEVIDGVPGMALRSISKEFPWPGGRCGWAEVYNRQADPDFARYIASIISAKRLEVCSTTLPQRSIPSIMGDERYADHLSSRNAMYAARAHEAVQAFQGIPGIMVHPPKGGFFLTLAFQDGVLPEDGRLDIEDARVAELVEQASRGKQPDKRFVYYLLGARGICVVPLSGFCTSRQGFRMTLLESDDALRQATFRRVAQAVREYLGR
ncbi:pyridoxal phosphate-dependent aminotransferase [Spirochaeta lutea]|uniref:alanine transaminase n=1 Tax=Spirochaeta lutea TaxID=1480694 RepID=A0A098R0E4_9SPIO|nr:pyridoxal phosphate-dependent aminotransferase [Spirochaeta lutea]KGE73399.1 aminotransferase [Spirochaeta lutea]